MSFGATPLAPRPRQAGPCGSGCTAPSGSGSRGARIHTSCAVVVAPTFVRALAKWCFTVERDSPRRWAAAYEPDPSDPWAPAPATGSCPYQVPRLPSAVRRVKEARSALRVVR